MVVLDSQDASRTEQVLTGGKQLQEMLAQFPQSASIAAIYPAYRASVEEKQVKLTLSWAIQLGDGTVKFLMH
ncbi:MAG: hypothetical protein A2189_01225 [Paenibacillus sp. RIFOXYA1_FULL_44_5]|nr:MAG: hypothetical protein A2189_01225 [Paenibacillus sp. RIFOXYA1_FULL_44_5]